MIKSKSVVGTTKFNKVAGAVWRSALSSELSLLSFHFLFSVEGEENKRLRVRVSILILTLKPITKM